MIYTSGYAPIIISESSFVSSGGIFFKDRIILSCPIRIKKTSRDLQETWL